MADDVYVGRLVCTEDGDLKADDGSGDLDELKSVYHDVENNCYRYVKAGEPTHNERHSNGNTLVIDGTSGPLYDAEGNLVYEGDLHHESTSPTDPHFSEGSPKNTKSLSDPDDVAVKLTSHTEAYTNA